LRDRPRPRASRADGDRLGRPHERVGARARRADAGGGGRADPLVVPRPRPDRQARGVPALGEAVRALREPDRAADLAAVVVPDGGAQAAGPRGAARAADRLPPGVAAPLRDLVARGRAGLEHLAPDLVGPPAAGLVLR